MRDENASLKARLLAWLGTRTLVDTRDADAIRSVRVLCSAHGDDLNESQAWKLLDAVHIYRVNVGEFFALNMHAAALNHSCTPNATLAVYRDVVTLTATRPIPVGEEITVTYWIDNSAVFEQPTSLPPEVPLGLMRAILKTNMRDAGVTACSCGSQRCIMPRA
jgi:SET domain-containing protein